MRVGVDGRSLVNASGRGISRYTRALLTALACAYPDDEWLVLVSAGPPIPPVPGVRIVSLPLPGRLVYGLAGATGHPRLDGLLGGVDVFWAPTPAPLALTSGVPFVLSLHDLSWELRPFDFTPYERLWHRIARPRRLATRATRVIAVSETTRSQAIARWGLDPQRVITVEQSVHPPGPQPDDDVIAAARRRHALPSRYFLSVGALEPRKAPEILGRAYQRARAEGLDAHLAVVGEGRLQSELGGPGVHRLGRVSDVDLDLLYAGALALVMPSRLEGFGLPPLEAALRGVPSIVTDLPIFRSTLGDGALRVPVDDEAALAAALTGMASDPVLRDRLATSAEHMAGRFTPQRAARGVHSILTIAAARS